MFFIHYQFSVLSLAFSANDFLMLFSLLEKETKAYNFESCHSSDINKSTFTLHILKIFMYPIFQLVDSECQVNILGLHFPLYFLHCAWCNLEFHI